MENIYADYGNIVEGDRYIHREKAEKEILARLIENEAYASASLVGMQRMGKSSLANRILVKHRKELLEKHIIVVKLSMYSYKEPQTFFVGIMESVYEVLEDLDIVSSKIDRRYRRAVKESVEDTAGVPVLSFFKAVKETGYRVICIIDEFDKSKELFREYPEGYFVLREMAYQPENKIAFLFLSRHLMSELEAEVGYDVSNFSNILTNSFLTLYTEAEFETYFQYMEQSGVPVTEELKDRYREITGRVPFWMDILSFYYVNALKQGENVTVDEIFEEHQSVFYNEFQKMLDLLKDQDLLNTIYQVILGPLGDDATPKQMKRLENYGMILNDGKGGYTTVSRYFRQYMVMKEQVIDFYPLWNRTEKLFRLTGKKAFTKQYGEDWENVLLQKYTENDMPIRSKNGPLTLKGYLLEAKRMVDDMKSPRRRAIYEIEPDDVTILNGTTTGGLFELFKQEYENCFQDVFQMTKKEFTPLVQDITSARNPYDHNNDHLIRADVKERTNENCSKFVKRMEAYLDLG